MNTCKKLSSLLIPILMLTACGESEGIGKEIIKLDTQLDCLVQLKAGSVDAAIIDSVMAGYYTSNGEFKNDLMIVENLDLAVEQYGIATRKADLAFMEKINEGLVGTCNNGKLKNVSDFFGVTSSLAITSTTSYTKGATDNSWNKVLESGKIIVGYTVFAPIAYEDETNNYSGNKFTGFDIELAREVVNFLNVTYSSNIAIEFKEIDWDSKEVLLTNGTIDLIWNGLTITDERKENMCISIPYLNNKQVAVIKKDKKDVFTTKESLKDAVIGVEAGSAGEDVALEK